MTSRRPAAVRLGKGSDRLSSRTHREESAGAARSTASEDVSALDDRLKQAERVLAQRKQSLYSKPWYLAIGPTGAGKSAWLTGLGLANDAIREAEGNGPTVTCDVLLFEEAVVLDVAGRLVTQDLDPEADRMAWAGLLRLLLKRRPHLPLSGVIVMVPAGALVVTGSDNRRVLDALHLRLNELGGLLGGRIPVYLVVTKMDAAPGTIAMLSTLDDDETEQVWGVTFTKAKPDRATQEQGFADVVSRLADQVILRQHHGLDERGAAGMWTLPRDLSRLSDGLVQLGASVVEAPSLAFRGVYLSAHPGAVHDARGSARAPFARPLFEDVILREAGMAQPKRRGTVEGWPHLVAAPLVALAIAAGLAWAYGDQHERLALAEATVDKVVASVQALPLSPVTDPDPAPVLPMLGALDWLRRGGAAPALTPWAFKAAKVRTAAATAYGQGIELMLEPRLLLGLEKAIAAEGRGGATAQVYLALAADPPRAANLVGAWIAQTPYPSLTNEAKAEFARHVDTMLRSATRPLAADAAYLAALSAPARRS